MLYLSVWLPTMTLRHGNFITGTFRHVHTSALLIYRHMDILSPWTFQHKNFLAQDILAPENFGTWIFWHLAKQYGRFGTDILAPVLLCRNVHMPKCPRAETSMVTKNHCAKNYLCQKVLVPKCPCARTPTGLKRARAKMSWWLNVCAEMWGGEMVGSLQFEVLRIFKKGGL